MKKEIITINISDLQCCNSLLRQESKLTKKNRKENQTIVLNLIDTLRGIEYGTGLSAIQIGIPVQIAVINLNRLPGEELIIIDPVVVSISGRITERTEGCLSLPNYKGMINRRNKITIEAYNLNNEKYTYSSVGYEAAIIQHELDHMKGIFYWDYMKLDNEKLKKIV